MCGQLLARTAWENKSWVIFMTKPATLWEDFVIDHDLFPDKAKRLLMKEDTFECNRFLVMYLGNSELQIGWHPSMDEMMAIDWVVVWQ